MALLSVVIAGAVGGCNAEEGVTPTCPPLPLYDVHDDSAAAGAINLAVAAGCLSPLGTAMSGSAPPPSSGSGGAGI